MRNTGKRRSNILQDETREYLRYKEFRIGNFGSTQAVYNSKGQFICLYHHLPSLGYMMDFNNLCKQKLLKDRTPEFLENAHKEVKKSDLQNQYRKAGGLTLRQMPHSRSTYGIYKGNLFVHLDTDYPTPRQMLAFLNMDPSEREEVIAALTSANGDEPTSDTMHLLCLPYWEKEKRREETWWDINISACMDFLKF